jgi:hypothetical protein
VTTGATLQCTFGLAPGTLTVLPTNMVNAKNVPAATTMDFKPMVNIMPFGACQSLANPTVASATSAAMGVLTPMPCIPNTTSPWTPGSMKVKIKNQSALTASDKCMCTWGGSISVVNPGSALTVQAKG